MQKKNISNGWLGNLNKFRDIQKCNEIVQQTV